MADVSQTINYNYKTNIETITRKHDTFDKKLKQVTTTTSKWQRNLTTGGKRLVGFSETTRKASTAVGGFGKGMAGLALRFVGYQFILGQVMGLQQRFVGFIKDSVAAFREFETRMAEVSTILGADALGQVERLSAGVETLSMKFGQATSDVAKGLYDILSAAFSTQEAINLLNTSIKASIAGLSDTRTSVQIFTSVLNAYGMTAEQATNVSNLLFQAVRRGKFQFTELESALGYIVPITAQAGIAFDELTAALSTATRHGLHLDMTARGLALGIQNIINPSTKAIKAAEKYGIEMNGLALQVMGLHGWFTELNEATKVYGKSILGELIPNMRSLRVAMVLAGDVGLAGFSDDLQRIAEMGNATEVALNKMMDTSQFVSNQISQEWEKMSREVGDSWDEFVLGLQRGVLDFVKVFSSLLGGGDPSSTVAGKFIVSGNDIEDAKTYFNIMQEMEKMSERLTELREAETTRETNVPTFSTYGAASDAALYSEVDNEIKQLEVDLADLNETSLNFTEAWNSVIGGLQDGLDELGNLELTLMNVELSIQQFEDRLRKPIEFGWGGKQAELGLENLKGSLYYELEVLKAEQKYIDITHDVTMGLKDKDYQYKELSKDMQENVRIIREYKKAEEDATKATREMSDAIKILQVQALEIQLKGMVRRRGLTRNEQKQLKKIQIEQAKLRLDNMKAAVEAKETTTSSYNDAQDAVDDYVMNLSEAQYQMKYSYDQQIIDLNTMIGREEKQLQTRYEWWETTNNKIISNSSNLINTLNSLMEEPVFVDMLEEYGIKVSDLEEKIKSLQNVAAGRSGTYVPSMTTTPASTGGETNLDDYLTSPSFIGSLPLWLQPNMPTRQRGDYYVNETGPVMAHRGERITPAGVSTKGGGSGIIIENLIIDVHEIADIDDVEKLGALLSVAKNSRVLNKSGKSRYRLR
jgi:TP901 family phage tail tape measure protein